MDLLLIRSLLAVAEHGGVTEAASAIGLSQSALSRRVQQLEEGLGTSLLERVGRGVVLTEMGKIAVEEGRQLVQRYDLLRSRIAENLSLDSGVVRIGGGASAVAYLLPDAIAAFRKRHPGVVFRVREAGSRDIETAVARDELELGIVTAPVQRRELSARRLTRDRIVLVASKEHHLAKQTSVPAQALQGENIIGFEAGTAVRILTDGALRNAQVQVHVVMELRSVAAILQMVETTRSLGFVSELAVSSKARKRRSPIVPIRVRDLNIQRDLMLIKKQGHTLSPAARAFEASFE